MKTLSPLFEEEHLINKVQEAISMKKKACDCPRKLKKKLKKQAEHDITLYLNVLAIRGEIC